METIFKTWKKATYFEGNFELRDINTDMASPVEFPTVFTAYGRAIKGGNWHSCTSINTPEYVIDNYFDTVGIGKHDAMNGLWSACMELSVVTWNDVFANEDYVLGLIRRANAELNKLKTL